MDDLLERLPLQMRVILTTRDDPLLSPALRSFVLGRRPAFHSVTQAGLLPVLATAGAELALALRAPGSCSRPPQSNQAG
jgi:hypothetical protein